MNEPLEKLIASHAEIRLATFGLYAWIMENEPNELINIAFKRLNLASKSIWEIIENENSAP